MSQKTTAGQRIWSALSHENPLQIAGTVNAYSALLAQKAGFRALYVSGAGVANASFGLPDLGITSLNDVGEDVRRITGAVDLPVLVDVDRPPAEDVVTLAAGQAEDAPPVAAEANVDGGASTSAPASAMASR